MYLTDARQVQIKGALDQALAMSHDPDTRTAAVIMEPWPLCRVRLFSANRFPDGFDREHGVPRRYVQRPAKYDFIGHAEQRVIAQAAREGVALKGAWLFMVSDRGFPPCATCARLIADAGIDRVCLGPIREDSDPRYSFEASREILMKTGVQVDQYDWLAL